MRECVSERHRDQVTAAKARGNCEKGCLYNTFAAGHFTRGAMCPIPGLVPLKPPEAETLASSSFSSLLSLRLRRSLSLKLSDTRVYEP